MFIQSLVGFVFSLFLPVAGSLCLGVFVAWRDCVDKRTDKKSEVAYVC